MSRTSFAARSGLQLNWHAITGSRNWKAGDGGSKVRRSRGNNNERFVRL